MKSLALKYRPTTWDQVVEQGSTKIILSQQIETKTFKQAYLFVGPAGCGKTTSARIFASQINRGQGNAIEIDAASHGNVDDIRDLVLQAKSKPLDCDYKVFIVDECHCLSSAGWSAMLKLIEEPPATAVFILCTTEVQKVPKTIISRCQRFDFQKISQSGIHDRLVSVLNKEGYTVDQVDYGAIEYIAKLADGGMRDALTLLDKCLAYSERLSLENVVKALGSVNYDIMFNLTKLIQLGKQDKVLNLIEDLYDEGKDLKQFVKQYTQFILDLYKIRIGCDWKYVRLPKLPEYQKSVDNLDVFMIMNILEMLVKLGSSIRYSITPKYDLEAELLLLVINCPWKEK